MGRADTVPRSLTICVDDFGFGAGIDDAAISLVDAGRVHAVGCMTTSRWWDPARAADLQTAARRHGAELGLHLDLTECHGRTIGDVMRTAWLRRTDAAMIDAAIDAQLDRFEEAFGHGPHFVDGHQHVHQFPTIRDRLLARLAARPSPVRPWIRVTLPRVVTAKSALIGALGGHAMRRLAARYGHDHNARFLGVYGFDAAPQDYATLLQHWLARARTGDLLMCHPAVAGTSGAGPADPIASARVAEYAVWSGDELPSWLEATGVQLVPASWRRVPHGPAS